MAIRARSDNLSLDHPALEAVAPVAPVHDFSDLWAHREALRQACYRMVGNAATAEDLVQDTYVRALKSAVLEEGRPSIAPWLSTVARRRTIDELRAQQRVTVMEALPERVARTRAFDDPAQQVVNQELVEGLRAALSELSARERQLLLRQVSHGLSLAELAAEESTSVASVRSVLARARHKLRMSLERGGMLGVLPVPRLVATLRARTQRWAAQVEGALPLVTGAGWQVGQVLAAVVVVVASLLGGPTTQPWSGTDVATLNPAPTMASAGIDVSAEATGPAGGGSAGVTVTSAPSVSSPTAVEPPRLALPSLPRDSASAPEQAEIGAIATTSDPDIAFLTGKTRVSGDPAIFRTTDGGQSWHRLPAEGYEGGPLLVPPAYPTDSTLFSVGPTTLMRSDDDGEHFGAVAPSRGAAAMSPDFSDGDPRIVIAGTPLLEYRADTGVTNPLPAVAPSADAGGIAFVSTTSSSPVLLVGASTVDGTNPRTSAVHRCTETACARQHVMTGASLGPMLYVSKAAGGGIFAWRSNRLDRSDDSGLTFAPMTTPAGFAVGDITEGPSGELLLSGLSLTSSSGLYSSVDDGISWTAEAIGTRLASGARTVATFGSRILAVPIDGGGLLCSTDSGSTWAARCAAP